MANSTQITKIVVKVEQRNVKHDINHYLQEEVDPICDLSVVIVFTTALVTNNLERNIAMQVQIAEVY